MSVASSPLSLFGELRIWPLKTLVNRISQIVTSNVQRDLAASFGQVCRTYELDPKAGQAFLLICLRYVWEFG